MDLGPSDHHFNTCVNRDLSDIECSTFNRAIGDGGATHGCIPTLQSRSDGQNKGRSWAHVVGHDSTDFAKSDSANRIVKRTIRLLRENFSLKTDVISSSK